MIYRNDDYDAIDAMEIMRTGNYGEDDFEPINENKTFKCPICSSQSPQFFYINDNDECVGCSDCITKSDTP